jgi:hypothetical protein
MNPGNGANASIPSVFGEAIGGRQSPHSTAPEDPALAEHSGQIAALRAGQTGARSAVWMSANKEQVSGLI